MSKPTEPQRNRRVRCAIYTRKSSEEGLGQEFNSLDHQRESAEAFIASHKGENWTCSPERYDDPGYSGGTMDRPGMKKLWADIEAGKVDSLVCYKLDRVTRSIRDFGRLMELLERQSVALVVVTQPINTSTSMGRLMVHVLMSFAQFERELASERTRDKVAAARRKGMWAGGRSVLGYDVDPATKKLAVNAAEADRVREIFAMYLERRSLLDVCRELNRRGLRTKAVRTKKGVAYGGREWDKVSVLKLLGNVLYVGRVRHKADTFPGEHAAIVDDETWSKTHEMLRSNGRAGGMFVRNKHGALLKGLLYCAPCGVMMGHTTANKGKTRIYRYYACYRAQKQGWDSCPCKSLPAEEIERFVVEQIKRIGTDPALLSLTLDRCREQLSQQRSEAEHELGVAERELAHLHADLARTAGDAATDVHAAARLADLHLKVQAVEERAVVLRRTIQEAEANQITKAEVDAVLGDFDGVWSTLSPKEKARLVRMLVQRVDYDATKASVSITFHPLGLRSISQRTDRQEAAA